MENSSRIWCSKVFTNSVSTLIVNPCVRPGPRSKVLSAQEQHDRVWERLVPSWKMGARTVICVVCYLNGQSLDGDD